ncbi:hypothetical protein ASPCAL06017 [Aspergillus calidoustus]|uniref:Peptidase S8/S53 domain-containing protein n=1 Tax=Aspergillus calidoustus TaxID=454130 RepID=A0A0U5G1S1_ASPCI|nr:hypothetical protein ASPCAL06017 [Aspergillus calidoustus]
MEEIKYKEGVLRTVSIYPLEPKKKGFLKLFVSKVRTRHPPVSSPDRDIVYPQLPTSSNWTSLPRESSPVSETEERLPALQAETIHIHNASSVAPNKEIGSRSAKPASAISPGSESGTNAVTGDTRIELTGKNTADSNSEHESRSAQLQGDEGVQALDTIQVELDPTEEHTGLTSADPHFQSTEEQPAVVPTRPEEVFDFTSISFVDDMQISKRESDRWFNTWMAKVERFLFQFRRTPPDPAHIAIQYSINTWKVDIICMAFSFSDYQRDIHDAIRQARVTLDNNKTRAVLFFAAASNHRHNEDIPVGFPARLDDVIAAFSCKYNGQMSGFSPYPVSDKFAVPGEVIKAAFPPDLNNQFLEKRLSGTSATTAIIAGIAGLVIEYVKLKADTAQSVSASDQLWYAQGMKSVLSNCMTTNPNYAPGDYFVVKPWLLLSTKHSDLDVSKQITWALWKTL